MRSLWFCAALLSLPALASQPTVTLNGAKTSGSLLIGEVQHTVRAELNGKALPIAPSGNIVFGFGRNTSGPQQLVLQGSNGEIVRQIVDITPREYQIDRVDGVPQRTVTPDPYQQARAREEP